MQYSILSIFRFGLMLLCLGLLAACEEDEFVEAQVPPPSNLAATFQLADDNSGALTIVPLGDGVARFEIFFGDTTTAPAEVLPGQTVTHVYSEGDYTLRIVGFNLRGESAEATQPVVIRFAPPENLTIDVTSSNRTVTVTPAADGATLFEVFFTERTDADSATVVPGGSATFVYDSVGTYLIRVVARSVGSAQIEDTVSVTLTESINLPVTFEEEDLSYNFGDFGAVTSSVIDNPDASGLNTSGRVAQIVKASGAGEFDGTTLLLGEPIDFASFDKISIKVWSPKPNVPVLLKVENADDNQVASEVLVTTTQANAWEELIFDFGGDNGNPPLDPAQAYQRLVFFFDFNVVGDGSTFFMDDIRLTTGGPSVSLPLTFENTSLTFAFEDFGGATAEVIDNPDPSGGNLSGRVVKVNKEQGAETFAGTVIPLDEGIDFGEGSTLLMKTWSPKVGSTVRVKLESSADPQNIFAELDAATTVANGWEELSYDFSGETTVYDRFVIFFDFGESGDNSDYYFDDVRLSDGTAQLVLPITFEGSGLTYNFENFAGGTSSVIANPDPSGINPSDSVVLFNKAQDAQGFAGSVIQLSAPIDFAEGAIIRLKTWSPKVGSTVRVKLESSADPQNIFAELDATTTVASTWEELSYDFSEETDAYDRFVIFFDFDETGDNTDYYYDDIRQTN